MNTRSKLSDYQNLVPKNRDERRKYLKKYGYYYKIYYGSSNNIWRCVIVDKHGREGEVDSYLNYETIPVDTNELISI